MNQDSSECIDNTTTASDVSHIGNLEIHVDLPSRNREKKTKTQEDIEMAFKRRLNRDIKERQVLLHKTSLLCRFGRIFFYNRLLNNTILMQNALKLLPSKSAYPPDRGTEIKYFQSMVTWFKSVIKLKSQNLYPAKSAAKTKSKALVELLKQIEKKEAGSKQDMIFILIILLRGMGLQCRLIVNMQPLPLKPAQSDLLTIKMKKDDYKDKDKNVSGSADFGEETSAAKLRDLKPETVENEQKKEAAKKDSKSQHNKIDKDEKSRQKNKNSNSNAKTENIKNTKQKKQDEECKIENDMENRESNKNNKKGYSVKKLKPTKSTTQKSNAKPNDEKIKPSTSHTKVESSDLEKNNYDQKNEHVSEKTSKTNTIKANKIETTKPDPKIILVPEKKDLKSQSQDFHNEKINGPEDMDSSQKENKNMPTLSRLKRTKPKDNTDGQEENSNKKPNIKIGSMVIPKIVVHTGKDQEPLEQPSCSTHTRSTRSRSKSPQAHISTDFLLRNTHYKKQFPVIKQNTSIRNKAARGKSPNSKAKISPDFLQNPNSSNDKKRVLRSRQTTNEVQSDVVSQAVPQLDGADDDSVGCDLVNNLKSKKTQKKRPNLKKLKVQRSTENSDEDFEPSPPKQPKIAPASSKKNRQVVSSDDEKDDAEKAKRKQTAGDIWLEVWCDVEEQWVCVDIFKAKIHCVDTIRKSASTSLAYVFAFQNDLSIKDVTARYCPNWTTVVRKSRVDKTWLNTALSKYLGNRTKRDIKEDDELRRIHEEKPMPTAIGDFKNHPFYALERHLLKFEALYPPDAPTIGYIRGEAVYSRDCVHTLHSREIWLKQARTVKLGEKPYKIVKARPKWDRITQTVIKDQPLEIFGIWQTQDYEPPTAENGLVPRNAYGNVELFKACMLPKKTKHLRLPGLNRICKKLGIDCANAVVGFDFHQGACHPTYDGFIVCEEFEDEVVAAWHQDQEEQERKEQEKYEARVYGNWRKLIRGLLIRERLKKKYNF